MDNTEQVIQTVTNLLSQSQHEAWIKEKLVLQIISKERKIHKKESKKQRAKEFRKNRIQVK